MDAARGEAGRKRFRVVERQDVRFTDGPEEVDIPNRVFLLHEDLRMILSEPAAAAFHVNNNCGPFIERHSLEQTLAYTNIPPARVVEATTAFSAEAETGHGSHESGIGDGPGREAPWSSHSSYYHKVLLAQLAQSKRWPPCVTKREVSHMESIDGARRHADRLSSHKKPSTWSAVAAAAQDVPELLFVAEARQRVRVLPVDPDACDQAFAELSLPLWMNTFRLSAAIESSELSVDVDLNYVHEHDDQQRVPAGRFREYANVPALELHIRHREFLSRFNMPSGGSNLGMRNVQLRKYIERLRRDGAPASQNGIRSMELAYAKVAGHGRRFAVGPSLQYLPSADQSVALRGIGRIEASGCAVQRSVEASPLRGWAGSGKAVCVTQEPLQGVTRPA